MLSLVPFKPTLRDMKRDVAMFANRIQIISFLKDKSTFEFDSVSACASSTSFFKPTDTFTKFDATAEYCHPKAKSPNFMPSS